eukprot:COSAG05_NODE_3718_length_1884_cov_1.939530_2_plen_122_part_00
MSLGSFGGQLLQDDGHSCGVWALAVEVAFVAFIKTKLPSFGNFWATKMAQIEDRAVFIAEHASRRRAPLLNAELSFDGVETRENLRKSRGSRGIVHLAQRRGGAEARHGEGRGREPCNVHL